MVRVALARGARGRQFKSARPDQSSIKELLAAAPIGILQARVFHNDSFVPRRVDCLENEGLLLASSTGHGTSNKGIAGLCQRVSRAVP